MWQCCAADDCGYFDGDDAYLRDFIIRLCGTNENGDKCYEILDDAVDALDSQDRCLHTYFDIEDCICRSVFLEDIREQGCCIDIYYDSSKR